MLQVHLLHPGLRRTRGPCAAQIGSGGLAMSVASDWTMRQTKEHSLMHAI